MACSTAILESFEPSVATRMRLYMGCSFKVVVRTRRVARAAVLWLTWIKPMKQEPVYPQTMNQAVATLPVRPPRAEPVPTAPAAGWLGEHRGPLTVTDSFAVLDDPVEQQVFTEFADIAGRRAAQSVLMVQGMTCAACADTVESALQGLPGVDQARVHAATRRLTLRWDPALTRLSVLARAPMYSALI
eukprot:Opistho-1_new@7610